MSPLEMSRAAHAKALEDVISREAALASAIESKTAAEAAFDAADSEANSKKLDAAAKRSESRRRLLDVARDIERKALGELRTREHELAVATCATEKANVSQWRDLLAPMIAATIEADRALYSAVLSAATVVSESQDAFDIYADHAGALLQRIDIDRPEVHVAREIIRLATHADRIAAGRECVVEFVEEPKLDWKTAQPAMREIEETRAARDAQIARDIRHATAAAAAERAARETRQ